MNPFILTVLNHFGLVQSPPVIDPCGVIPSGHLVAEWDFEQAPIPGSWTRDVLGWDFGSWRRGWDMAPHDWQRGPYGVGDFVGHEGDFIVDNIGIPSHGASFMMLTNPTADMRPYTELLGESIGVDANSAIWPGGHYAFVLDMRIESDSDPDPQVPMILTNEFQTFGDRGVHASQEVMVTNTWTCYSLTFTGSGNETLDPYPGLMTDRLGVHFGALSDVNVLHLDHVRLVLLDY